MVRPKFRRPAVYPIPSGLTSTFSVVFQVEEAALFQADAARFSFRDEMVPFCGNSSLSVRKKSRGERRIFGERGIHLRARNSLS